MNSSFPRGGKGLEPMTDWRFLTLVVLLAYCGVKLTDIAAAVAGIRKHLSHVHPILDEERK
jgi:hypothetical protein